MKSPSLAAVLAVLAFWPPAVAPVRAQDPLAEEPPIEGREVKEPAFRYSQRRHELETAGLVTYFYSYLGHDRGPVLSEYLTKWKSAQGQIWQNEGLHLLVITDTPESIELLKAILRIIDRPDPQVLIEVRVVEVSYDSSFELGGELTFTGTWEVIDTDEPSLGTFRDSTSVFNPDSFLNSVATRQQFQGLTGRGRYEVDSNTYVGSIDYTLRTLMQRGQAEILSAPRILVVNGKKASFVTGDKVPIQSVNIVNNVQNVTTTFENVGVKLDVTPHIMGESAVELQVKSEVSAVTGFTQSGILGVTNPIISVRSVDTTVYVRDGETLIIGGLLKNESVVSQTGIPILMDIPILGYLFKSFKKTSKKTELIFFLTPHIRLHPFLTLPPRERDR